MTPHIVNWACLCQRNQKILWKALTIPLFFIIYLQWERQSSLVQHLNQLCRLFILTEILLFCGSPQEMSLSLFIRSLFCRGERDKKPLEIHIWYLRVPESLGLCNQQDWENEGEGRLAECETGPRGGSGEWFPGSLFVNLVNIAWLFVWKWAALSPGTFTGVLAPLQLSADMSWWDIAAWINQHSMHDFFFLLKKAF